MNDNDFVERIIDRSQSSDPTDPGLTREVPVWRRYLGALLCIAVAFAVRYWLSPILGEELPFMLFIAASLVAAWYGGAAAGIIALLLGLFLADYFFMAHLKAGLTQSTELLYLVRYLFTASVGIALIETLHRSRRRLQREVARRRRTESALLEAQAQLRIHAEKLERSVSNRTAELAASVKYLESLLYHIGHNLRAPLRAMEGYATVLVDEYGSTLDVAARDYSAHISDAAKRMDQLIHDLLEYGRLGYVPLPLVSLAPEEAIERVLFRLGFEIRMRKARVDVIGPWPRVLANAETFEQVLTNLIENAIHFVPTGTRPVVGIHAQSHGVRVRIIIEDNGPGIPAAYRERIFGVFQTLHPSSGRAGTGIGLAIVKQGMQRMGGTVGVEDAQGGGSRFWIELPAAAADVDNGRNGHPSEAALAR